jgi:translation initiation factor 4B
MAPKKKEVQKFSLGEFINEASFGGGGSSSWADEVEDTYGTQPLPSSDRRGGSTSYGGGSGSYADRGYHSIRDNLPQTLPTKPPFTAHLGNLSYDATQETVTEFFEGCKVVNVRIIEDREQGRPKGFAYAEFEDVEGLKQALTLDGVSFQGRTIRIKIADPPKDRDGGAREFRDLDWGARRGPLEDPPSRGGDRRGGDFGDRRGGGDFGDRERRPPREHVDDGKVRDFGNWERKGPLPAAPEMERTESRDRSRAPHTLDAGRSESYRGTRRASPAAWGPREGQGEGSRPPRREFVERPERPERVPTAAEKDNQWRERMRPDAPVKSPIQSRDGSEAPPSPAGGPPAQPAGRPKLNLTKRTVSDTPGVVSPALSATDPKANPFGAARPIDTAARERLIEEKRLQAIKEKKEADEKAKEEKRLAKEAAAKEAAEKEEAEAAAKAAAEAAEAAKPAEEKEEEASANGDQKVPIRTREPREPKDAVANPKSRATESGNWRSASGDQRAPSRGGHIPSGPRRGGGVPRGPRSDAGRPPRANGGPASSQQGQVPQSPTTAETPSTPTVDEDGWTTVPNKGRRGGRP